MRDRNAWVFWSIILTAVVTTALVVTCAPPPTPTPTPTPTITPTPSPVPTSTPTPSPTPSPTPEPPAVFLWHNLPDEQAAQLETEIARFNASYQKMRVVPRSYPDDASLKEIMEEDPQMDGMILGNGRTIASVRDFGLIQPVDTLFDSQFLQGLAAPGLEGAAYDNQIWAIPHTLGMQLMLFYNTQMIADPPADTASMIEMASKLTGPEKYGLGMNALDPLWLLPWLSAYGGWPVDGQGELTLNTEPMIQALTFMRSLALEHSVMPATADYDTGVQSFKTGQIAMWVDGEWALSELRDAEDVQWGVALLPILADTELEPACLVAGRYFAIGAGIEGDKLEAARLFIAHIVGPDASQEWTRSFRTLPSSLAVLNSALIQQDPFLRISATQMLAGRGVGLSDGLQQAMEIMRGPLEDVMYNRISPKEAVRGMQARVDALSQ